MGIGQGGLSNSLPAIFQNVPHLSDADSGLGSDKLFIKILSD